ncbi:MAG: hypothetical protein OSB44_08180 [Verrucomicrobiales bacterium]|nr:hypothetical protein [Verrucomicrobiales bacterium]
MITQIIRSFFLISLLTFSLSTFLFINGCGFSSSGTHTISTDHRIGIETPSVGIKSDTVDTTLHELSDLSFFDDVFLVEKL